MSQKKVDAYKMAQKNRQQIMRREKLTNRIEILAVILAFALLIGWFGTSVYSTRKAEAEANAAPVITELDLTDMDAFSVVLRERASGTSEEAEETADESVAASSEE